mgnify:CR=1 FL=1
MAVFGAWVGMGVGISVETFRTVLCVESVPGRDICSRVLHDQLVELGF